jgi:transposase InsO family protein
MAFGRDAMDAKREFVKLARRGGKVNFSELCRRFEVSRSEGYNLLERYLSEGEAGLVPRSRRPKTSPTRTSEKIEAMVLELRDQTHWGARKISHRLRRLGSATVPRTTVQNILKRNGRITDEASDKHTPWKRFEHQAPNDLWQMDFKGWFMTGAERCNPLTIVDDRSRFSTCLRACADQKTETVQAALIDVFSRYGLPWRMTMDNGSPWGDDGQSKLTKLVMWLVRLGVAVSHSRPFHPQTQGKDERFHRTLDDELLRYVCFRSLSAAQDAFNDYRDRYNLERPHESLEMSTPAEIYHPSKRSMPDVLAPIEYPSHDQVRKVDEAGNISYRGQSVRVGRACAGLRVAIRPTSTTSLLAVFFCHQRIMTFQLD